MVYVDREKPHIDFMAMKEYHKFIGLRDKFYDTPSTNRKQQVFSAEPSIKVKQAIIESLLYLFKNKCAFCESPVKEKSARILHFRPQDNSKNNITGQTKADGFWKLSYTWENLYLSCPDCNKYKSSLFPTVSDVNRDKKGRDKIIPLLIDPCAEFPEEHIKYMRNRIVGLDQSGDVTIEVFQLNRQTLLEQRQRHAERFLKLLHSLDSIQNSKKIPKTKYLHARSLVMELESMFKNETSFSGLKFSMLENWVTSKASGWKLLNDRDWLKTTLGSSSFLVDQLFDNERYQEYVSSLNSRPKRKTSKNRIISEPELPQRAFIRKVIIENFKSIKKLTLDFDKIGVNNSDQLQAIMTESSVETEGWLMLLGENGVGKSSVLQAITLCMAGQKYLNELGFYSSHILNHDASTGSVRIIFEGALAPAMLTFKKGKNQPLKSSHQTPPTNILAYGSTRLTNENLRTEDYKFHIAGKNLFDPTIGLSEIDNWLVPLPAKQFNIVAIGIKQLVGKGNEDQLVKKGGKIYLVNRDKEESTIQELSDGYKYTIALAIDIMKKLIGENSSFHVSEGIVLIDEIGNHLHPSWKMRVVSQLKKVFPKIQFIVTTHDPLCLKGLSAGEIIVFKKDLKGKVHVNSDVPDPSALRADQILSSDLFGLNSTVDPEVEDLFDEYYELLFLKKLSNTQKTRLALLKESLKDKNQLGNSLREELMLNAIDKVLSVNRFTEDALNVDELKATTENLIKDLWDEVDEEKNNIGPLPTEVKLVRIKPGRATDDPWKGVFGGKAKSNGRILKADVEDLKDDWFGISLEVSSTDKKRPLSGKVKFYLHDSFNNDKPSVNVKDGIASLYVEAYGAFTVGVEADEGTTRLELDLSENDTYPKAFRAN